MPTWYIGWNSTTVPSYYTTTGNFGLASPSYKFGVTADTMITPTFATSTSLSFWIKGEGSTFSDMDTLTILQSIDSINWNVIPPIYLDSMPTTGTTMTFPINAYTTNIMFIFTKYIGNLAMDDIQLSYDSMSGIKQIQNNTIEVFNLFPNPSTGKTFIQNNTAFVQKVDLSVYDMLGNEVISFPSKTLALGNNNLNLSSLSNGVYFVRIQNDKLSFVHRITISK
jgi:type IX secretion system substrate protein